MSGAVFYLLWKTRSSETRTRGRVEMRTHWFGRSAFAVATAAGSLSGVSVLLAKQPAGAANPKGITCSKMKGLVDATAATYSTKLKDCTGNTGGKSKLFSGTLSEATAEVKWANGTKTIIGIESRSKSNGCASGDVTEAIAGFVMSDTTHSTRSDAGVNATICYDPSTNALSLLPGQFKIDP
jgi:hypothetical protein